MILLAHSSTRRIMPRGSNVELRVDKRPLLVSSFLSVDVCNTITLKVSVSVSHCKPSDLSMGSLSRSKFFHVLSSAGLADNTSFTFEKKNFVKRKLPLCSSFISFSDISSTYYGAGTTTSHRPYRSYQKRSNTNLSQTLTRYDGLSSEVPKQQCRENLPFQKDARSSCNRLAALPYYQSTTRTVRYWYPLLHIQLDEIYSKHPFEVETALQ